MPKIPSYKITDVATAIAPECEQRIVGIRAGEKLHEEMVTSSDSLNTYDLGQYYVILPQKTIFNLDDYLSNFNAKAVEPGFSYNSKDNEDWLSVDDLRGLIDEHVTV